VPFFFNLKRTKAFSEVPSPYIPPAGLWLFGVNFLDVLKRSSTLVLSYSWRSRWIAIGVSPPVSYFSFHCLRLRSLSFLFLLPIALLCLHPSNPAIVFPFPFPPRVTFTTRYPKVQQLVCLGRTPFPPLSVFVRNFSEFSPFPLSFLFLSVNIKKPRPYEKVVTFFLFLEQGLFFSTFPFSTPFFPI